MRIIFTGGGTAGHINPALAIASYVRARHPEAEILYIGSKDGMEARLVPAAGFRFEGIHSRGIIRRSGLSAIKKNVDAVIQLYQGRREAARLINEFKPDLVLGTGGYVSAPVIMQAASMGVHTLTHEQNAFPGITTKLVSRHVDTVLLAVEEAKKFLSPRCNFVVTGNPVREEIIFYNKAVARKELSLDDRLCILSFGGSLGARAINEAVADLMAWHSKDKQVYHIHGTGKKGYEPFLTLLQDRGVTLAENPQIIVREYIDDMPRCNAAADLVISRAGAITLSEIQASCKASILIPSPNVTENHQYHNAMVLGRRNAAVVIEEKDLTGNKLIQTVSELIETPETIRCIAKRAGELAIIDANERIYSEIKKLL
ncbi:undecaprenyldiphospho-muramoylpentapeptide beta-N-acetylglucosaminyltransferase [Acetanaerobacterium elongatum]|uniref:UDP-N-acetylglucosamine--N-acetylmuramyl-(pentapeptide) pyrophosphoryl-undecaprenol N-acetylglucosamine transferase n=1 Tax=Acetanaerobacterium elongatum TaxID=258515 RepID=A0A1G9VHY5_9FIRM|nr:undecaprenyldiphospho-muramoylpentapeptide beta-N-acetylglucosaminyltransferase [Acetanaerobacterium elongatum]SDM71794.1 UDP-N-acetylglucosamine-N-acetylmuramylpentapeptide N-acetylglucosamine transferase [Acetanaerobacterium elongatum]